MQWLHILKLQNVVIVVLSHTRITHSFTPYIPHVYIAFRCSIVMLTMFMWLLVSQ